jgi:hypothetical protein
MVYADFDNKPISGPTQNIFMKMVENFMLLQVVTKIKNGLVERAW